MNLARLDGQRHALEDRFSLDGYMQIFDAQQRCSHASLTFHDYRQRLAHAEAFVTSVIG